MSAGSARRDLLCLLNSAPEPHSHSKMAAVAAQDIEKEEEDSIADQDNTGASALLPPQDTVKAAHIMTPSPAST